MKYPLIKPYFNSGEIKQIEHVLDSGWVSYGPKVKQFETNICKYLDVAYAISTINCTSALHLSLLSLGIKDGDEVIVSDFTFPATGHAVMYCGATPRFADIDDKNYTIDLNSILSLINTKTKAIIPVHAFGHPAKMYPILELAKEYNLEVIEDAACALGSKYKKEYAGTLGTTGCFSFHARKPITSGEGGVVVTNNKMIADYIRNISIFGMESAIDRKDNKTISIPEFTTLGYNYKMSDITAVIANEQLKKLDNLNEKRIELALYWTYLLNDIPHITPPEVDGTVTPNFQSYVALVDEDIDRDKLINKLLKKEIETTFGTYSSHIQPIYKSKDKCPISLDIHQRSLALPLYYKLKKSDIDIMAEELDNQLRRSIK